MISPSHRPLPTLYDKHKGRTSILYAGFEAVIPAVERPHNYARDGTATGVGIETSLITYLLTYLLTYLPTYLLTYLLTPWCRVLLEQLPGLQLVKKFPAFHGIRRFITALTSVRQLSLSWASPIQSTCPHPTSWRSIPILSTHLRLDLPSGLLPSGFPTKTLYNPLSLKRHYCAEKSS